MQVKACSLLQFCFIFCFTFSFCNISKMLSMFFSLRYSSTQPNPSPVSSVATGCSLKTHLMIETPQWLRLSNKIITNDTAPMQQIPSCSLVNPDLDILLNICSNPVQSSGRWCESEVSKGQFSPSNLQLISFGDASPSSYMHQVHSCEWNLGFYRPSIFPSRTLFFLLLVSLAANF